MRIKRLTLIIVEPMCSRASWFSGHPNICGIPRPIAEFPPTWWTILAHFIIPLVWKAQGGRIILQIVTLSPIIVPLIRGLRIVYDRCPSIIVEPPRKLLPPFVLIGQTTINGCTFFLLSVFFNFGYRLGFQPQGILPYRDLESNWYFSLTRLCI